MNPPPRSGRVLDPRARSSTRARRVDEAGLAVPTLLLSPSPDWRRGRAAGGDGFRGPGRSCGKPV